MMKKINWLVCIIIATLICSCGNNEVVNQEGYTQENNNSNVNNEEQKLGLNSNMNSSGNTDTNTPRDSLGQSEQELVLGASTPVYTTQDFESLGKNEADDIVIDMYGSYSSLGLCYCDSEKAYFSDYESGTNVVLCTKADCPHIVNHMKTEQECDGYIGNAELVFIDDQYEIFIQKHEYDGENTKDFMCVDILKADIGGKNRRVVATLEDVQAGAAFAYDNKWLAYAYQKTMDVDLIGKDIVNENTDKFWVGIYLVNVDTGEVRHIEEMESYDAILNSVNIVDNKVYFVETYFKNRLDFSKPNIDEQYVKNMVTRFVYYDIVSGENKVYYETNERIMYVRSTQDCYFVVGTDKVHLFKMGEEIKLKSPSKLLSYINSSGVTGIYIYDSSILIMKDGNVFAYDYKNGDISEYADGKLKNKGVSNILAIIGDKVFYSSYSSGFWIYGIDFNDFVNGKLVESRILK